MAKKASYEGVTIIRNNLEDLLARMLALKRDGQDAKNSSQLRELVTEASVMFVDLRRVRFSSDCSILHCSDFYKFH